MKLSPRIAIYARVSSDQQVQQDTIASQLPERRGKPEWITCCAGAGLIRCELPGAGNCHLDNESRKRSHN